MLPVKAAFSGLTVFLAVAAHAQTEHVNPVAAEPPASLPSVATPAELETGRRLFLAHCAACHGPEGEGGKGPTLAQPKLPRASTDEELIRIITTGISGTEMPRSRLDRDGIRQVAAYVRSLGNRPPELLRGDAQRGARLYAERGGCAACHSLQGYGGAIGLDLSNIGRQRSAAYLRRSLVEPAADVPQSFSAFRGETGIPDNFMFIRLTTRQGVTLAGVRVNEDAFSIQIRDLGGAVHSFFKSELAELHKDRGFTPMPSFAAAFAGDELDDLVAFLASLQGKK